MFTNGVMQEIPGVLPDAQRLAVNEPLWTLPYELWAYAGLFALFVLGGLRKEAVIVAGALFFSAAWAATSVIGEFKVGALESVECFRLGSFFLSGALLAVFWPYIKGHAGAIGGAGLIGLFLCRNTLPVETVFHSLSLAAAVTGLGNSKVMAWFSKSGDASYGIYVFAWPVQQFFLLLIGSFWLAMLAAFLASTALGYATWHLFEKRAILYTDRLAEILRSWAELVFGKRPDRGGHHRDRPQEATDHDQGKI